MNYTYLIKNTDVANDILLTDLSSKKNIDCFTGVFLFLLYLFAKSYDFTILNKCRL